MIHLKSLRKTYESDCNRLEVLKGIDLTIDQDEFVTIMGSSGPGQYTLPNILGILNDYDDGEYALDCTLMKTLMQQYSSKLHPTVSLRGGDGQV